MDAQSQTLEVRVEGKHKWACAVQVWYDDPRSLAPKFRLAAELGLRGVGVWNLDLLEYSAAAAPAARQQTRDMWDALRAFTG